MRIRDARPADAEALHALYHEAYAPRHDPHRAPMNALHDTLDDVRGFLREGPVLVAEEGDAIVGSVALRPLANLRRLAVDPGARRDGLASTLLEAAVERARAEGYAQAMLDTLADHPWLPGFYGRRGFKERCVESFPDGTTWRQLRLVL
jgi:GNAT superfamily N-acetyltransferase